MLQIDNSKIDITNADHLALLISEIEVPTKALPLTGYCQKMGRSTSFEPLNFYWALVLKRAFVFQIPILRQYLIRYLPF